MRVCQRVFALFFCCCLLFSMLMSAVPVFAFATEASEGEVYYDEALDDEVSVFAIFPTQADDAGAGNSVIEEETLNIFERLRNFFTEIPTYFSNLGTNIKNLPSSIGTWINNLATRIETALDNKVKPVINLGVTRIETFLENKVNPVINSVSTRVEAFLENKVNPVINNVAARVESALEFIVGDHFKTLKNNISSFFADLGTKIVDLPSNLKQYFDDLGTKLKDLPSNLKQYFDDLGTKIKNIPSDIKQFFDDLGSKISNLASALGLPSWLSDLKDSISSSFIVTTFQRISEWFQGLFSFFDSPSMSDDGEHKNFFDYLFGTTGSKDDFWSWFRDLEFQSYLQEFYWSISLFWTALPLAIRYLILFGFGFPFMFCIIKAFAR